jgi:hypothetical protein
VFGPFDDSDCRTKHIYYLDIQGAIKVLEPNRGVGVCGEVWYPDYWPEHRLDHRSLLECHSAVKMELDCDHIGFFQKSPRIPNNDSIYDFSGNTNFDYNGTTNARTH